MTFLASNQESLFTMSLRPILEGLSLIIANRKGLGVGMGTGVRSELDDTESEYAGTTKPMMNEISDDLEFQVLELPATGGDGFPQMARVSRALKL